MPESSEELQDLNLASEDTQAGKYLTFLIGAESFGLSIKDVTEIIGLEAITPIPDVPKYIKGLINLRGKVIPIMDVRLRFGMEARDYDARTCIVVVDVDEARTGLVVDTVSEVADIDDSDIEPAPAIGGDGPGFMAGIGKVEDGVRLLLDARKLLFEEAVAAPAAAAA